jgi:endoglucanase
MTKLIRIVSAIFLVLGVKSYAAPPVANDHIKVDQFGYRCQAQKIAVISVPQTGFNAPSSFAPGTGADAYELRAVADDAVVYAGTISSWNAGATHSQSGDKVWWFDFSEFSTPGEYYVFDVTNQAASYPFSIRDDVYKEALREAVRSFYYQRCGTPKLATHAGAGWADGSCHTHATQDTDCRSYQNPIASTSRDLSGGWHDAGDYNKYVNFTWRALTDLLLAYEENPGVWTDDYNLPESGNGIPDLLDEIKYELDWLLKMQNPDGSVLSVVGGGSASPPSQDFAQRLYGPATTSATFSAASMYAQGAVVFRSLNHPAMSNYATVLATAAKNAWGWAKANPDVKFYNAGKLAAGEQEFWADNYEYEVRMRSMGAACFLYKYTEEESYKTYFETNYNTVHLIDWSYAYPFENTEQDILLYFAHLPGVNSTLKTEVRNKYSNSVHTHADNFLAHTQKNDAYRAFMKDGNYTWGSNATKTRQANMYISQNYYELAGANADEYTNAASGYLHYMHGVNPLALVYLSNMGAFGAENSVKEFYHAWFTDGSPLWDRVGTSTYGPAPGFIPGGPQKNWSLDACCSSFCGSVEAQNLCVDLTPPNGQPVQKSYREWNTNWPQNSWSITENAIYYNAPYIRLVAHFAGSSECIPDDVATSLANNTHTALPVRVYPNPFDKSTTVEISTAERKVVNIRILSVLGQEVVAAAPYSTNEKIEIGTQLPSGVYVLEIQDGKHLQSVRLIKQ